MPNVPASRQVTSISELIDLVDEVHVNSRSALWFRGHRDGRWRLLPNVFRDGDERDERNFVHRFRARAGTRYPTAPRYGEFARWLGLMQHYRLPTRLLDWTRSPLIAAYFAIESFIYEEKPPAASPSIWVLKAHDLNRLECRVEVTPSIEAEMVQGLIDPAFLDRPKAPVNQKVMAVMASEFDYRMFVQQGCFTIHSDRTPLEQRPGAASYLTKIAIPHEKAGAFAKQITICGFRKGDIYPDLEHLADELRILKGM